MLIGAILVSIFVGLVLVGFLALGAHRELGRIEGKVDRHAIEMRGRARKLKERVDSIAGTSGIRERQTARMHLEDGA